MPLLERLGVVPDREEAAMELFKDVGVLSTFPLRGPMKLFADGVELTVSLRVLVSAVDMDTLRPMLSDPDELVLLAIELRFEGVFLVPSSPFSLETDVRKAPVEIEVVPLRGSVLFGSTPIGILVPTMDTRPVSLKVDELVLLAMEPRFWDIFLVSSFCSVSLDTDVDNVVMGDRLSSLRCVFSKGVGGFTIDCNLRFNLVSGKTLGLTDCNEVCLVNCKEVGLFRVETLNAGGDGVLLLFEGDGTSSLGSESSESCKSTRVDSEILRTVCSNVLF